MKHVLIGYRLVDFKDKTDGHKVEGISLYTLFDSVDVNGQETAKLFVNVNAVPDNLDDYLGLELDVDFNNKGRVVQLVFPKPVAAGSPAGGAATSETHS